MADKAFEQELKKFEGDEVVLLSGGTASGKTEFLSKHLCDFEGIVFDGTLPTLEGAKIKIKKILKAEKKAVVCAILPDNLERAFGVFLNRERQFSDDHFYRTHSQSRKALLKIAENFPEAEIRIYQSMYTSRHEADLIFPAITFKSREELIKFLKENQLPEKEVIEIVNHQ